MLIPEGNEELKEIIYGIEKIKFMKLDEPFAALDPDILDQLTEGFAFRQSGQVLRYHTDRQRRVPHCPDITSLIFSSLLLGSGGEAPSKSGRLAYRESTAGDDMVSDGPKQTGVALEKAYQFILWLVPTGEKFPRSQKFLLGDRMPPAIPSSDRPRSPSPVPSRRASAEEPGSQSDSWC